MPDRRKVMETAKNLRAQFGAEALSIVGTFVEQARQSADEAGVAFWLDVALGLTVPPEAAADDQGAAGSLWWFMQRVELYRHRAAQAAIKASKGGLPYQQEMADISRQWRALALQADLLARTRELLPPTLSPDDAGDVSADWPASRVFGRLDVGVGLIDLEGRLLIANEQMRRFVPGGVVPSRDLESQAHWKSVRPDGRPVSPDEFPSARALRGETCLPGLDFIYTPGDGREIPAHIASIPMRDATRRVIGALSLVADLTQVA